MTKIYELGEKIILLIIIITIQQRNKQIFNFQLNFKNIVNSKLIIKHYIIKFSIF